MRQCVRLPFLPMKYIIKAFFPQAVDDLNLKKRHFKAERSEKETKRESYSKSITSIIAK